MSLLSIVQQFVKPTNLSSPATVYGTTDPQIKQILGLLEEEGNDLKKRGDWQGITFETTHTTLATEDQGAITTIAPNGFRTIRNETFFDRTTRITVDGPIGDKEWQALKSTVVTGPKYQYRIRGNKLLANPVPAAGNTWAFEYLSNNWITDSAGVTYKQYFTADTDLVLLPEDILILGLRWRWKREKGLDYAEDFRTYESQVNNALGNDGGKRTLNMGGDNKGTGPRVFIPAGNWI